MTTTQIPPDLSRESKGAGTRRGPEIRLERILAPVDFSTTSDKGIAFAAEVASRFHASIQLLYVAEPLAVPQCRLPRLLQAWRRRGPAWRRWRAPASRLACQSMARDGPPRSLLLPGAARPRR